VFPAAPWLGGQALSLSHILPQIPSSHRQRSDQVERFLLLPKRWIVERALCLAQIGAEGSERLGEPQPQGVGTLARLASPTIELQHLKLGLLDRMPGQPSQAPSDSTLAALLLKYRFYSERYIGS
jgi:hypothetical protein